MRADGSHRVNVFTAVCVFVFPHDISKTDAARIAKLDIDMFHHEFWKPTYFGVKRSNVKVTRYKNFCLHGFCTFVSTGFF